MAGGLLLLMTCHYAKGDNTKNRKESAEASWDLEALKRRGIISEQLDNLDKLNELPRGLSLVDISLNGNLIGSFQIRVNDRGAICFTPELFEALGLIVPDASHNAECYDWLSTQPDASINWLAETQMLSIVVPPDWLQQQNITGDYGGTAAHINYNYFSSLNTYQSKSQRYSWLSLYSGINLSNWLFRSQQNIQEDRGKISAKINSSYLEHYFSGMNKIVQLGEIYTKNTLFSFGALKGVQLFPDDMRSDLSNDTGVIVDGVANTPQARVEVRQYDQLIFSTLVPAGPFHLANIPVQNLNAELQVSVIETNGETQQFNVPVTQFSTALQPTSQGYSVAMGKLAHYSGSGDIPAILTMNKNWRPLDGWSLRTGGLFSNSYRSVAAAASGSPLSITGQSFYLQAMVVQNSYQRNHSAELRASSNHVLTQNLSLSLGVSKKSSGFATLEEAGIHKKYNKDPYRNTDNMELSVGLAWSTDLLGTVSLTHSRSTRYHGDGVWRYYNLNWNRRFGQGVLLTTSASRSSGGKRTNNNININFSWPLGENRFRHYYRSYNHRNLLGSDVNIPINNRSEAQLAVEEEHSERNRSVQASLSSNLRYTNINLSTQFDNRNTRNYSVSGNGSLVGHSQGITFSSNTIQDTYGLVKLSSPLAGIPVSTPGGTSWTDWRGMAVIPSLIPWHDNAIDIDVDRLPKNADVTNGHRTLRPARGSVKKVDIAMLTGTRLLMTISLADGRLLPKGSTVWSGDKIVAEAVDDGTVFITNASSEGELHIKIIHTDETCDINYQLPKENDPDSLYQQLTLVCK